MKKTGDVVDNGLSDLNITPQLNVKVK